MPGEHFCHAVGCGRRVEPKLHMCPTHWLMVPKPVQKLIWYHYRQGQEVDKNPSIDYICTAFVSISCVAIQEGKPLPTMIPRVDFSEFLKAGCQTVEKAPKVSNKKAEL